MAEPAPVASRKAWYLLHSWSGLVLAIMLYVLCASGCVALFFPEIQQWQHPELNAVPAPHVANVDAVLAEATRLGLVRESASFQLPHHAQAVVLRLHDENDRMAIFDAASGKLIATKADGFGRMLRELHSDLLLPFPYGTYLVGLFGILMLFLVVSGTVVHRRFYREAFTLRVGHSWRLTWSDLHKLAGTWGVAFLGMMAFTGALLGLAGLLFLQTAVVAYRGDEGGAFAALLGTPAKASGQAAPALPLAAILQYQIDGQPFAPRFVSLRHIGDKGGTVTVDGERLDVLSGTERRVFDTQGRLIEQTRGATNGAGWRVYSAMLPLHFANFGGVALKFLYLLLGVAACLMPVSGILLWLDRHERGAGPGRSHRLLGGLAAGVTLGLPMAVAALFLMERLAPGWMAHRGQPALLLGGVWFTACVWALRRRDARATVRSLLGVAGVLFLLVAPVNGWVTGDWLFHALRAPLTTAQAVDGAMLAIGIVLAVAACRVQLSK